MAPRKFKPVTLASIGRPSEPPSLQKQGCALAGVALRKFAKVGFRTSDGPTPERLLRAGGAAEVRIVGEVVEISRGSKFVSEVVDVAHVTVSDDPFSRLCARQQVDPDVRRNFALCQAGLRYRGAWRGTGLDSLRSARLEFVNEGGGAGLFASERAASSFKAFARVKEAVPVDFRPCVDAIVLSDRDPADVGRQIGAYRAETQARAVALFVLRRGLNAIAVALGILEPEPEPEIKSATMYRTAAE